MGFFYLEPKSDIRSENADGGMSLSVMGQCIVRAGDLYIQQELFSAKVDCHLCGEALARQWFACQLGQACISYCLIG